MITIQMTGDGWAHVLTLAVPADKGRNRTRSDQYTTAVDGAPWAERAGLVTIFNHARSLVPRRMTRHELATLER